MLSINVENNCLLALDSVFLKYAVWHLDALERFDWVLLYVFLSLPFIINEMI